MQYKSFLHGVSLSTYERVSALVCAIIVPSDVKLHYLFVGLSVPSRIRVRYLCSLLVKESISALWFIPFLLI